MLCCPHCPTPSLSTFNKTFTLKISRERLNWSWCYFEIKLHLISRIEQKQETSRIISFQSLFSLLSINGFENPQKFLWREFLEKRRIPAFAFWTLFSLRLKMIAPKLFWLVQVRPAVTETDCQFYIQMPWVEIGCMHEISQGGGGHSYESVLSLRASKLEGIL